MGCAILKGSPGSVARSAFRGALTATGRGRFWRRGEGLVFRSNGKADPQKAKLLQENQRLRELVANLSVDNLVLKKRLMGG